MDDLARIRGQRMRRWTMSSPPQPSLARKGGKGLASVRYVAPSFAQVFN